MVDYASKHHDTRHHQHVQALFLHEHNSPRELPRAVNPRDMKGCVGNLLGGYVRQRPLPLLPIARSLVQQEFATSEIELVYFQVKKYCTD